MLMIEQRLISAREASKTLKQEYDTAVATRATAQRNVNSLLERKDRWTDSDVADFTSLIRSDHASNAAVSQTSSQLNAAESNVDRLFSELTKSILTRYHEEQIWSDKIRSFSSWANLVGLLVNLVVFVGAIAFVEPWKRRKLAEGLETRIAGMMESVQAQIEHLAAEVGERNGVGRPLPSEPILATPLDLPTSNPSSLEPTSVSRVPLGIHPPLSSSAANYLSTNLTRYYHYLGGSITRDINIDPAYLVGASGLAIGAAMTYMMR